MISIFSSFVQTQIGLMPQLNHINSCTISHHQCECFKILSSEEKKLLDENSVLMRYKKREMIFKRGSLVSSVLFVEKGLAKVFIEDNSNSLVMKLIPEGNLLGLSSLSEEYNTYQNSAMTYIDSQIRQYDIAVFRKVISENALFAKEIINIMAADTLQVYGRFFCLTHKQAYGTLADILLCLTNRIFKQDEFTLPLSRRDLAELSGMSQETVIRMLGKFNEEKIISMNGKSIKIIDPVRLTQISEKG